MINFLTSPPGGYFTPLESARESLVICYDIKYTFINLGLGERLSIQTFFMYEKSFKGKGKKLSKEINSFFRRGKCLILIGKCFRNLYLFLRKVGVYSDRKSYINKGLTHKDFKS